MEVPTAFVAGTIALMISVGSARAQQVPDSGARVRIGLQFSPRVIGRVVRRVGDSLEVLLDQRAGTIRIPLQQIRQIELTRGRRTMASKGLLIGAAIGVSLGVAIGAASPHGAGDLTQGDVLKIAGIELGLLGGLTGLVVGVCSTGEDWFPAPRSPSSGRVNLGVGWRVPF